MKTLIIYYSYGGNTRRVAELIREETGGVLLEIETMRPYEGSYREVLEQGRREVETRSWPELKPMEVDLNQYDSIFLGTPTWWYTCASAVTAFLLSYDLSGKRIHPFITCGDSKGNSLKGLKKACPGMELATELEVKFQKHEMRTPEEDIRRWSKDALK